MRAELFAREPLCVKCLEADVYTLATQRDHVIPLAEGGRDDQTNEQGLCESCHEAKSLAEALRGAARGRVVQNFGGRQRKPRPQSRIYGE